jgi:molybdopterin synthase catalytic subunit
MIKVELTNNRIQEQEFINKFKARNQGAISVFLGTTRDIHDNKKVVTLEYHAYEALALKQMNEIMKDAIEKYNLISAGVVHRLGTVDIGETSLVMVCTSVHRKNCLHALDWCVDQLKLKVAVYKKEFYKDGFVYLENQGSREYYQELKECTVRN